jgi:hypothetical protein
MAELSQPAFVIQVYLARLKQVFLNYNNDTMQLGMDPLAAIAGRNRCTNELLPELPLASNAK